VRCITGPDGFVSQSVFVNPTSSSKAGMTDSSSISGVTGRDGERLNATLHAGGDAGRGPSPDSIDAHTIAALIAP